MLVLARGEEESIFIGEGEDAVKMKVIGISKKYVRLAFDGPKHVKIDREEVRLEKEAEK